MKETIANFMLRRLQEAGIQHKRNQFQQNSNELASLAIGCSEVVMAGLPPGVSNHAI
jgi:hypothetical protein